MKTNLPFFSLLAALVTLTAAPIVQAGGLDSFQGLSQNIFIPKCLSCHSGKDVNFTNYDSIMHSPNLVVAGFPEKSMLFVRVANNSMPLDSDLSPTEVQAIRDWITSGAPEGAFNTPLPGASPSPSPSPAPTP